MDKITKERTTVKAIAKAVGYKGRTIRLVSKPWHTEQVEGGGTRYDVHRFDLATGRVTQLATPLAFGGPAEMSYEIADGMALVITGRYCGKDAGLTIIVRPFVDPGVMVVARDLRLLHDKPAAYCMLRDTIAASLTVVADGCGCGGAICKPTITHATADLWMAVLDARFVEAAAAELRAPREI